MTRHCDRCGAEFEAVRTNAVYCSTKCRMAAHRAKTTAPGTRANVGAVTPLPAPLAPVTPPSAEPGDLLAAVIAEAATCPDRAAVAQAVYLARAIESGPPPHTLAALHRQLAAARAEVRLAIPMDDTSDPIDLLHRRRDLIRQVSADHAAGLLSRAEADLKTAAIREALAFRNAG